MIQFNNEGGMTGEQDEDLEGAFPLASRDDVMDYIGTMLQELRDVADRAQLPVLAYFLEMALGETKKLRE